jgi:hypothetical protein
MLASQFNVKRIFSSKSENDAPIGPITGPRLTSIKLLPRTGVLHSSQDMQTVVSKLVLPNSHHFPAHGTEHSADFFVSLSILSNLVQPKHPICRGNRTATLTAMPEAAVQKDRDAGTCEDHIRSSRETVVMSEFPTSHAGSHEE